MTVGERVRKIRKDLGLTLEQFSAQVGVHKTSISKLERGDVSLSTQMERSICREFNVNKDWLTDGKGDPFVVLTKNVMDELCEKYKLDDLDRRLIEEYMQLSDAQRAVVKNFLKSAMQPAEETREQRINRKVENYRRELELQEEAAGEYAATQKPSSSAG